MAPIQPRGRPNTRRHLKNLSSKQLPDRTPPSAQNGNLESETPELGIPQHSHGNVQSPSDDKVYMEIADFKWDVSSIQSLFDLQMTRQPVSILDNASILSPGNILEGARARTLKHLLEKVENHSSALKDLFLSVVKHGNTARDLIAGLGVMGGVYAYIKKPDGHDGGPGSLVIEHISNSDTIYL
jgi:hypothetical protein